ncbi:MAG TPA: hypothetical protein VEH04_08250 [Verrucomicrobiae bacterium]|nr:hypothetical protein [Verrucomicrobiae bacterium]
MTNAIGTGTANLSINIPLDERSELGRAAVREGCKSVGEFVRKLVLAGAEVKHPELAVQLKEVRRKYYGGTMLILILCAIAFGSDAMKASKKVARKGKQEWAEVEA